MLWHQKFCKCPARALLLKSWENHRNLKNSVEFNDFMSPRGALAILQSCVQGTNPFQKNNAGHMRAAAARDAEILKKPLVFQDFQHRTSIKHMKTQYFLIGARLKFLLARTC